jgi:hypothetical protein
MYQGQGQSPAGMTGHYHAPFMSAKLLVHLHRKKNVGEAKLDAD